MRRLFIWIMLLTIATRAAAQPQVPEHMHPRQVFLIRSEGTGTHRLIFLDLLNGEQRTISLYGERYTITPQGVLFYAPTSNRVQLALPDGSLRDHPFIQPGPNTRRIDWVIDPDARLVAWTTTEGTPGLLTTVTRIAQFDGADQREVLVDGPRDGIRALPIAFSAERTHLYMDYQPDSIADFTSFRQYAGLFQLDLASSELTMLPGEPGCFCGAGVGGGWFLRLLLTEDQTGFDLRARALERSIDATIPALRLSDFTQGGDIVIAADGTQAVYALAQIRGFGTAAQTIQTVFVLVDLQGLAQVVIGSPVDFLLRPTAWTEDNSAVLLVSPTRDGTWKLDMADGALSQISTTTYLGSIGG
jgi:hypothetical protein